MHLCFAVLLALFALPAAAQTVRQDVYEGTIGKSPIVMEILTYRDGKTTLRAGQYFYSKYRTPIHLTATSTAGQTTLSFTETDPACYDTECPDVARLALKPAGEGLSGNWQAANKRTGVAVALKRLSARDYKLTQGVTNAVDLTSVLQGEDVVASGDGNAFLQKLYDANLTDGPETRVNGVGYRIVTDRATGVRYVRLTQHPNPAMLKTVNARLDAHRYQSQAEARDCTALLSENKMAGPGGYDDTEVNVAYLTPAILFVEEAGSTYCGGAHPNNFWTLTGYDLRTGRGLDMNTLLRLYDKPAGWREGDEVPESAQFTALKAKLTPKSSWFVAGAEIPDCLAEDLGYGYSLSFNDKGLVFSLTDLPHVMGACMGEYYVVPYSELKTLWRPEAKAYFPNS